MNTTPTIDALIRDLTKVHNEKGFLSKGEVRARLELLVQTARIEEWNYIHETLHSANLAAQNHVDKVTVDRIKVLKSNLQTGEEA